METVSEATSAKKKLDMFRKYNLLGQLAGEYADCRRLLRHLKRTAKRETKRLCKSKYPVQGMDFRDAMRFGEDLQDVLTRLIRADKVESYRIASEALERYLLKLAEETERTLAAQKPDVKQTLTGVLQKAKSLGSTLLEKGEAGVDKIKKTVSDLASK